jgi:hypothetical protein
MASNADPLSSVAAITFTPQNSVVVNVGRVPTNLYPRVDMDMPIWECAHAFHVNKTAIMNVDVDIQTQLDAFGSQLNLSAIVDGCKADFTNFYGSKWMDSAHLTIQSFHNSAGDIIAQGTCCVVGDPSILKLVQNGNIANCRPPDIKFVQVGL